MVMIGIGCAVAGFGELKYDIVGLACQLSAILVSPILAYSSSRQAESTRLVLMELLLSHRKLGPLVAIYYYAPVSASGPSPVPFMTPQVCLGFLAVALPFIEGTQPFLALPELGWGLLLLNGAVAFGLNVAGVYLIQAAGSLVLTLSGILKVRFFGLKSCVSLTCVGRHPDCPVRSGPRLSCNSAADHR